MKKTVIVVWILSVATFVAKAQKEANYYWYFGEKAGIAFQSGKPEAITDGVIFTDEGCATICSKTGELLFYTDGKSVWNKKHEPMPNGQNLFGHASSTQSGVAIPFPRQPNFYILFTVDAEGKSNGLAYSVINMNLENGLRDIDTTQKNIQLHTRVTEKLTAVKHRNGKHIWVLAHEWMSDAFLAYLVTEKGVTKEPIIAKIGKVREPRSAGGTLNTQGYIKLNPNGTNIALALEETNEVQLFDFDNATAKVSNPIAFTLPNCSYPYGIEFSPNGSLLYVSAAGPGKIYQYNLQQRSSALIDSSKIEIGSTGGTWVGALQLAPDGKIYFPICKKPYLGCIHFPNQLGAACKYENDVIELQQRLARLGLPTFAQSFFEKNIQEKTITYLPAQVKTNTTYTLKNVLFDYAKFNVKPNSFAELDKLVVLLKNNLKLNVKIIGHTDNIGNKPDNLVLSESRANAVKKYVVQKGIAEKTHYNRRLRK